MAVEHHQGLPTKRVTELEEKDPTAAWLIEHLWQQQAVGVLGGAPKCFKSWLGLDMAISVASATACLGRFAVPEPGPALVYLAEDSLSGTRDRIAAICAHRGVVLEALDLHVVTAPSIRLDLERDQKLLDATLQRIRPRVLLLDPLVRLHRLDENSAAEISGLLGFLRELNRKHQLAIVLVHHMAKKAHRNLGLALRGSSDINAWTDSAAYLVRKKDNRVLLSVEHRAAPAPEPLLLQLQTDGHNHLQLAGRDLPTPPLEEAVRAALRDARQPRSRLALRKQLRVNNHRLGKTLEHMQQNGIVVRTNKGWALAIQTPKNNAQFELTS